VNAPANIARPRTPIARDFDLSALMREYGIRNIWRDPLLDRFSVTLLDYSSGQGGSVGEALQMALAERRAA
jgi:hypothetical protein